MRRTLLFCAAIAFAIACGDSVTEPVPTRTLTTPPIAFATTTTEDGLSISTDKDDYQPGDVVHFTGYGWQAGDVLDIVLTDDPLTHEPHTWTVNVGTDGMFLDSTYVVDEGDLNVKFTLVATSRATGRSLTVQFTDAELVTAELAVPINDVTVTQGTTANFNISLSATGAIKCVATVASPSTAKVHTAFSLSATGVLSSTTFSPTFDFFAGAPAGGPNNCDVTWTGAPTPYSASASVSAAAGTPTGDYSITLSAASGTVVVTNPGGSGGSLADADLTRVQVHVVAPTDQTRPTVAIDQASGQADPTNASPINFTVVFSEPVTGFATGDVTLSGTAGATTATVSGSGTTYNVAVSGMTGDGTVIATIAAGVASDAASNTNVASTSTDNTVTYDKTGPTVAINQAAGQADPTNGSTINFTVVFNKSVTAFATGDVTLSGTAGATTATVTGSGTTYNVAVSGMANDGTVIATVAADVAQDGAGNGNMASSSTDNTVTYDATRPTVAIEQAAGQADPTNGSTINFTVTFNEAVTGFATGDVSLSGTAGATTATVTGSGTTYNVAVSGMAGDGTVIATVGAGVASDAATNTNVASTSTDNTVTYDVTPPDVSVNQATGQADPTNGATINFTVVFSETVSDFATGDVTLTGAGATTATVTGSGTTYNVAVTGMTTDGTVSATIGVGKAHDAAGNGNTASTSTDNSVLYDGTPPVISCGTADGAWHATDVSIACTASDATSGLAPGSDASFSLTTSVAAGTETNNAFTDSRTIYDVAGNNAIAGPIGGNMIDKKGPVVTLTCPLTPVILNASASATWTAVDGGSGVAAGFASGSITLNTSSVGTQTATAGAGTSKDKVNNNSLAVTCTYSVIFNWTGFFQPVDNTNLNVVKAGSAIPVKFNLGGYQGLAIFASGSPSSSKVNCADIDEDLDTIEETVNAGGSSLTYDATASQYVYVWKTDKNWTGCRRLDVKLIDGTTYSAYFKFKS